MAKVENKVVKGNVGTSIIEVESEKATIVKFKVYEVETKNEIWFKAIGKVAEEILSNGIGKGDLVKILGVSKTESYEGKDHVEYIANRIYLLYKRTPKAA